MSDERRLAELADFERGLAALTPQVDGVDRDALLFLAGQQSVSASHRRWVWPAMTAVSTLAAVVLAVMLVQSPGDGNRPMRAEHAKTAQPIVADQPADPGVGRRLADEDPLSPSYFRLRQIALASGIDAVPDPLGQPTSPLESTPPIRVLEGRHYRFD